MKKIMGFTHFDSTKVSHSLLPCTANLYVDRFCELYHMNHASTILAASCLSNDVRVAGIPGPRYCMWTNIVSYFMICRESVYQEMTWGQ